MSNIEKLTSLRDVGLSLQRNLVSPESAPGTVSEKPPALACGRILRCGSIEGLTWEQLRKPRTVLCLQHDEESLSNDGAGSSGSARVVHLPAPADIQKLEVTDAGLRRWLRAVLSHFAQQDLEFPMLLQSREDHSVGLLVAVLLLLCGISEQRVIQDFLLNSRGSDEKRIRSVLRGMQKAGGVAKLLSSKGLDDDLVLDIDVVLARLRCQGLEGDTSPPSKDRSAEGGWLKEQVQLLMKLATEASDAGREQEARFWHNEAVEACAELAGVSSPKEATIALAYQGHALVQLKQFRAAMEALAVCKKLLDLCDTEQGSRVRKMVKKSLTQLPADTPQVQVFTAEEVIEEGLDPHLRVLIVAAEDSRWKAYTCPEKFSWLHCGTLAASVSPGLEHSTALQALGLASTVGTDAFGSTDLLQHYTQCVGQIAAVLSASPTARCLVYCCDGFAASGIALACFFVAYGLGEPVSAEPGQPRMNGAEALEVVRALRPGSVSEPEEESIVHSFDEQAWTRHIQRGQRAFGQSRSSSGVSTSASSSSVPVKPAPPGAKVVRQPGDGNCLFHSLSYSLGGTASTLRAEICNFMEKNPDLEIAGTCLHEWVQMLAGCSVEVYAKRMAKSGVWGSAQEIAACAHLKRANIHVYQPKGSGFELISAFDISANCRTVAVLYNGGTHYDAMVL